MADFRLKLVKILADAGCDFVKGDHEIWRSPLSNRRFTGDRVMAVNLKGVFFGCKRAVQQMAV